MKSVLVRKDSYYDSVFLMLISREVKKVPGITDAVVGMGTEMNLDLLAGMGFGDPALKTAGPNDLVIALAGVDDGRITEASETAERLIREKKGASAGETYRPRSLGAALRDYPDTNLVLISLPGPFAVREARRALETGRHVMLFSDNVPLDAEIALKRLALEKGLLMMGPDCGTAIIGGKPLCFANVVRRGDIGIVAASGTGLQEVICLIDAFGGGVSQAIGTGGRDLKDERVGGMMMLQGIEALAADPATRVITVVSKPPAPAVADRVIAALEDSGKPAVVHLIGRERATGRGGVLYAGNLEETAAMAVALSAGSDYREGDGPETERGLNEIAETEARAMGAEQKFLRGLYTGGTLADEALFLLHRPLGGVYSNNHTDPAFVPADPLVSRGHTIVDMGDDAFTVGRPHPMIDPGGRAERITAEAEDPETAVLLMDFVLGYGSHPDPAGATADRIVAARRGAAERGGHLSVVVSITGTPGDFQGLEAQRRTLEAAGCLISRSNYRAALLARTILERKAAL